VLLNGWAIRGNGRAIVSDLSAHRRGTLFSFGGNLEN
jgi:hypothetical protein